MPSTDDELLTTASQWLATQEGSGELAKLHVSAPLRHEQLPTAKEAGMMFANYVALGGITGMLFGAKKAYSALKARQVLQGKGASKKTAAELAKRVTTVRSAAPKSKPSSGVLGIFQQDPVLVIRQTRIYGLRFSAAMGLFVAIDLGLGMLRQKRDVYNRGAAGFATGAALGGATFGLGAGAGYGVALGGLAVWTHQLLHMSNRAYVDYKIAEQDWEDANPVVEATD